MLRKGLFSSPCAAALRNVRRARTQISSSSLSSFNIINNYNNNYNNNTKNIISFSSTTCTSFSCSSSSSIFRSNVAKCCNNNTHSAAIYCTIPVVSQRFYRISSDINYQKHHHHHTSSSSSSSFSFSSSKCKQNFQSSRFYGSKKSNKKATTNDTKTQQKPPPPPIVHTIKNSHSSGSSSGSSFSFGEKITNFFGKYGVAGAFTLLMLSKAKSALVLLKFAKLGPLIGMMASVVGYTFFFGWSYAVGIVVMILAHESGHYAMFKYLGIPCGPIILIPFIGGGVFGKLTNAYDNSIIAIAGPMAGGLFSVALHFVAIALQSQLILAVAYMGLFLNLFNLVPFPFLDGGNIIKSINPKLVLLGVPIFGAIAYFTQNPIILIFLIAGVFKTFEIFAGETNQTLDYLTVPLKQRYFLTTIYILLIFLLLAVFVENKKKAKTPGELQQEYKRSQNMEKNHVASLEQELADAEKAEEKEQKSSSFSVRMIDWSGSVEKKIEDSEAQNGGFTLFKDYSSAKNVQKEEKFQDVFEKTMKKQ